MLKKTSTLHKKLTGIQEEDNMSQDESRIRSKVAPIDLKEKIQRKLTTNNPQAPKVIVRYNFL